jgi:hypothetical protein
MRKQGKSSLTDLFVYSFNKHWLLARGDRAGFERMKRNFPSDKRGQSGLFLAAENLLPHTYKL